MLDWHEYVTGELIVDRLTELRAEAALQRQIAAHRAPREPLRVAIGRALIRVGSWIEGPEPAKRMKASYRRA
ncbi:MAG TPA: hypothetical protein VK548_19255 [Candidatus Acidoferrum sp.]|nr:hypothetical protein [Candidatus Acidoferrum sp.]